jgi:hypothetical protein|tara:strand:+ start:3123 stop:3413 length:291 start_codon:yes stop_codon:yes gene_type:complete
MNEEKLYLVTEADLKAFYDAKGRVADALAIHFENADEPLNHVAVNGILHVNIFNNYVLTKPAFDYLWDDNVGGTFEYMLRGQKLRSQDYESLEVIE